MPAAVTNTRSRLPSLCKSVVHSAARWAERSRFRLTEPAGSEENAAESVRMTTKPPPTPKTLSAFRRVPRTGVIYVSEQAARRGFTTHPEDWCNLGQGQPDTGVLAGAPTRLKNVELRSDELDYAPVAGLWELRAAVASLYNHLFRAGKRSQYTADNVAICGGGRVSIMRACAAIGPVHMGHFLPDYTAYEELLDVFRRFQPIPIPLDPERGYAYRADELRRDILGLGLGAILMSNPCNPTGRIIAGEELEQWVHTARAESCALLMDEFYSHYIWGDETRDDQGDGPKIESAARYVDDVDEDPVVIFDGLTKNWRYPGFRVSWIVGPRHVVDAVSSAGSFLDGGGSAPMQRAAVDLLTPTHVDAETTAIHNAFRPKRDFLVNALRELGIDFDLAPQGTFYAWANLKGLPEPLQLGDAFFQAALEQKVICVPGHFFDVNPGKRRLGRPSRFRHHVRFSFGPPMQVLERAVDRLSTIVRGA